MWSEAEILVDRAASPQRVMWGFFTNYEKLHRTGLSLTRPMAFSGFLLHDRRTTPLPRLFWEIHAPQECSDAGRHGLGRRHHDYSNSAPSVPKSRNNRHCG